jgi:hypothetical protein
VLVVAGDRRRVPEQPRHTLDSCYRSLLCVAVRHGAYCFSPSLEVSVTLLIGVASKVFVCMCMCGDPFCSLEYLEQWFPTRGTRTPGGTRRTGWEYAKIIVIMAGNTKKKELK